MVSVTGARLVLGWSVRWWYGGGTVVVWCGDAWRVPPKNRDTLRDKKKKNVAPLFFLAHAIAMVGRPLVPRRRRPRRLLKYI